MPTERQIKEAYKVARELCPGVRIKSVGPEGVIFDYPTGTAADQEWSDKPFSGTDL
ncbi:MAG: hypothetical protein AAF496_08025 [Pseudomonadota bacterium]